MRALWIDRDEAGASAGVGAIGADHDGEVVVERVGPLPARLNDELRARFDVAVLDLRSPAVPARPAPDQVDATRVRAPGLPLVVLVGACRDDLAEELFARGADDVLIGPRLDDTTLRNALRSARARARARAAQAVDRADNADSADLCARVIECLPTGVVVLELPDAEDLGSFLVVRYNAAASAAVGADLSRRVGRSFAEASPDVLKTDLPARYANVIRTGRPTVLPDLRYGSSTAPEATYSVRVIPIDDRRAMLLFKNVTEQRLLEARERDAADQSMVNDRMASLGMLAASVAHEINNPLGVVLAHLALVEEDVSSALKTGRSPDLVGIASLLSDARVASQPIRAIVRDLRVFARHDEEATGIVDVRGVLESSLRIASNQIRFRAKVTTEFGHVPGVKASEQRLGQVFLNLLINAAQAIPEGHADRNEVRVKTCVDESSGRVCIEVADTGQGISPDARKRLFTPFFTTKPAGVGTGLGLAVCQRIVTGYGGEIQVESTPGKGATFRVLLPACGQPLVAAQVNAAVTPRSGRRGRVLVIDDEPLLALAFQKLLKSEHDVVTATSASDGLERLRRGETFDAVLCDLMMPQTTGMGFYAAVQAERLMDAAKVIFMTGGAFTAEARAFLDTVPNDRIEKPFDRERLRALVNRHIR